MQRTLPVIVKCSIAAIQFPSNARGGNPHFAFSGKAVPEIGISIDPNAVSSNRYLSRIEEFAAFTVQKTSNMRGYQSNFPFATKTSRNKTLPLIFAPSPFKLP